MPPAPGRCENHILEIGAGNGFPVVGYQSPCVAGGLGCTQDRLQSFEKVDAVGFLPKDLAALDTAANEMVQSTRGIDAGFTTAWLVNIILFFREQHIKTGASPPFPSIGLCDGLVLQQAKPVLTKINLKRRIQEVSLVYPVSFRTQFVGAMLSIPADRMHQKITRIQVQSADLRAANSFLSGRFRR